MQTQHKSMKRTRIPPRKSLSRLVLTLTTVALLVPAGQAAPLDEPLPPLAVTADSTGDHVVLAWEAPPGNVDGYRVYRADDATDVLQHGLDAFTPIGTTDDLIFVDLGNPTGDDNNDNEGPTGAIYYVTSLLDGEESGRSNIVTEMYPHCWKLTTPDTCFIP